LERPYLKRVAGGIGHRREDRPDGAEVVDRDGEFITADTGSDDLLPLVEEVAHGQVRRANR
jgi:hypothetical protein